ncbi:hypothetical protein [Azospirillum sp. Marseille-Q6669]
MIEIIIAGHVFIVTLTVSYVLQFLASTFSMATHWLMGSKVLAGPMIGLVSTLLWTTLVIHDGMWGMIHVEVLMLAIHTRNLVRWLREARAAAPAAANQGEPHAA